MKKNEELIEMLSNKNDLNHRLPDGDWHSYLLAMVNIMRSDIGPMKQTVRLQKVMRYIYEHESVSRCINERIPL